MRWSDYCMNKHSLLSRQQFEDSTTYLPLHSSLRGRDSRLFSYPLPKLRYAQCPLP